MFDSTKCALCGVLLDPSDHAGRGTKARFRASGTTHHVVFCEICLGAITDKKKHFVLGNCLQVRGAKTKWLSSLEWDFIWYGYILNVRDGGKVLRVRRLAESGAWTMEIARGEGGQWFMSRQDKMPVLVNLSHADPFPLLMMRNSVVLKRPINLSLFNALQKRPRILI